MKNNKNKKGATEGKQEKKGDEYEHDTSDEEVGVAASGIL